MCGILGFINIKENLDLEDIKHRGPDDSGIYSDLNLQLGHVRLSIQDLSSNAHQPFISENEDFVIIFNGEIYNHWNIRSLLEKKGYKFKSTSDTETILTGYIEYGSDIIYKLNGIFAFAIYDKKKRKLIIARDRFGVKPLYYFQYKNKFAFSSELKALHKYYPDNLCVDINALSNYLRFLWSPGERTPFKEIQKLLPGRYMEINLSSPEERDSVQYFRSGFNSKYSNKREDELIEELDNHLQNSVKRQLLSDTPVGFFLSGGLDSSLLVAIARKLNPDKRIQCFTIDTEAFSESEGFSDDLFYAKQIASILNVDLEIVGAEFNIIKNFDEMIWHLDEPQADPAPLNVQNISRRAKSMGYKVLIGGTGGDDVFSGYRRHQVLQYNKYFKAIPSIFKPFLIEMADKLDTTKSTNRRIKKLVTSFKYSEDERPFSFFEWLEWKEILQLFNEDFRKILLDADPFGDFKKILSDIPNEKNQLNQMLHLEMNSFLVDHNLNYTDKMGMAEGVEIRVPYLDNDLVEFSYIIPPELKLKGKETKYILKKVAERYLPKEVIYRSKSGFGAPVRKWITEDMDQMINKRLSEDNTFINKIFDHERVKNLIQKNKAGVIDASYIIWALLAIDSWMMQFYKITTEK